MINQFFALAILFSAANANAFTYVLEITESEIQQKVEQKMPFVKKKYFVTVALSQPRVSLKSTRNNIGVTSNIMVKLPGGYEKKGHASVEGRIKYTPNTGEFYFIDPTVKKLKINQLPEKFESIAVKIVNLAIKKSLDRTLVYKFKDDNLKHKLVKATLKSVKVMNGKLALELGM